LVLTSAPYAAGIVIGVIVAGFFAFGIFLALRTFWFSFHDWRRRVAHGGDILEHMRRERLP
jgi:hypothetical protein